jgi:hypothetical protein
MIVAVGMAVIMISMVMVMVMTWRSGGQHSGGVGDFGVGHQTKLHH